MSHEDEEYISLVTGMLPGLRRVAHLMCGDWHRADDLVQETFTRLYLKWRKARQADNIEAYVRTILVRVFLNEYRRPWRSRTWVTDQVPDTPREGVDREAAIDVQRALAGMPPRQRAVLVLRYYCDLTIEQTARTLECSSGNVKSQTARGLDTLRRILGPADQPMLTSGGDR